MSKAFTRESDDAEPIGGFAARVPAPPGVKNYITAVGAKRLRAELDALRAKRLAEGASANASDARIRQLQSVLTSTIVPAPPADRRKIAFGSLVGLRHGDGETGRYQIVGLDEANPADGLISWLSPLAKALISHAAGETVRFQTPAGEETLTILSVEQPDP